MTLLAVFLSLALTLLAVIIGMAKVQRLPASLQIRDQARVSAATWTATGWVELVAAAGVVVSVFAVHELAIAAALVLCVSYLGFAIRQISQRVPAPMVVPAVVLAALAAVTSLVVWIAD